METVIVYRFENSKGVGPYASDGKSSSSALPEELRSRYCNMDSSHHYDESNHPSARNIEGFRREHSFCGFTSKEQIDKWFNKEEQDLLNVLGFKLNTYVVSKENVKGDGKQVIFPKESAVLLP